MHKIYLIMLFVSLALISILVILTGKQPVLVRKKVLLGLLIVSLTAPAATIVSCKSGAFIQKDVWQTEGWVNGDTLRVISTGTPKAGLKNETVKKGTAKEGAILFAQKKIIEKIVGQRIESCGGMRGDEIEPINLAKELAPVIKNGKVIAERYDADFNCEIIYEISSKDLKKRIESLRNY